MDSYTNPYGSQPSIPNGGQYQPTNYSPQGDIILTPTEPKGKLDLKRILILAGIGLAVVGLFIAAIFTITNNNRAATEAQTANREEKLTILEDLYEDYGGFLNYYGEIGYRPTEVMARELNDTNKLFVTKKATLIMLEIMRDVLEEDFVRVADADFSILGTTVGADVNQIIAEIKPGFDNMKNNIATLRAFYDAFIVPVQDDLDEETATMPCSFRVTMSDIDGLTLDGFAVEEAVENYNQAYCDINNGLYYETFTGKFDSSYVHDAKEALIEALLNTNDQSSMLNDLEQILVSVGSKKVVAEEEEQNYAE